MPTLVVLEVLDVLLLVTTNMINLLFQSSEFASDWKEALLKPLIKSVDLTSLSITDLGMLKHPLKSAI